MASPHLMGVVRYTVAGTTWRLLFKRFRMVVPARITLQARLAISSAAALARETDLEANTVRLLAVGGSDPRLSTLIAVAERLGIPLADWMPIEGDGQAAPGSRFTSSRPAPDGGGGARVDAARARLRGLSQTPSPSKEQA
jgi:transcriptional regulator with XRE-family HTH domain